MQEAPSDLGLDVSRETIARLSAYHDLLTKWNPRINLVSRSTLDQIWSRHFRDSAQLAQLMPKEFVSLADFGSGGGFPGLVLAIIFSETRPGVQVTLVDADQRKCTFLQTVLRNTGVSARVLNARIEDLDPLGADVVTARALAPLTQLLAHAERHLRSNGHAFFLKGARFRTEVEEALATWRFSGEEIPSQTSDEAVVLKIGELARV